VHKLQQSTGTGIGDNIGIGTCGSTSTGTGDTRGTSIGTGAWD